MCNTILIDNLINTIPFPCHFDRRVEEFRIPVSKATPRISAFLLPKAILIFISFHQLYFKVIHNLKGRVDLRLLLIIPALQFRF